jgi:hypothetical protein
MDLLAAIIAGGPAVIDVTVNGTPLSQLVSQIATTLKEQQNQIAELRDYTYKNDEQMWGRIHNLETGVSRINRDLGFPQREEKGSLDNMPTHKAISVLEHRVTTLDKKRQGMVLQQVQDWNAKRLMRQRFHTWINVAKRNSTLRLITGNNGNDVRRCYMRKWLQLLKMKKKQRVRASALEVLQRFNGNRLLRSYYSKWLQWRDYSLRYRAERHVALVRAVDAMASVSVRGFLRRKWLQWMQLVARRRLREDQKRSALRMAALSSRQLVRRYFASWLALEGQHNLRRRQLRTATALAVQSSRILAGRAFALWAAAGRRKKQRRTGAALIPRMAHDQSVRLASRYYIKLWRNAMSRRDERSRSHLEDMTRDLTRRFENLSGQVSGTMNQTQETVTALQKLSQQQAEFEKRQFIGGDGGGGGYVPRSASGIVRQATPPGRKPSPTLRSGSGVPPIDSTPAGQQPKQQSTLRTMGRQPATTRVEHTPPEPQRPNPATHQAGVDKPSIQALQLGTSVSQINLRGGGSGELSRVQTGGGVRSSSTQGRVDTQQAPASWLDQPEAAWNAMRDRMLQQQQQGRR